MKPIFSWLIAALVTSGAFAMATWICGALVLPGLLKDSGVRWGLAGALGVAVAALAALWGHSYATTPHGESALHDPAAPAALYGTITTRNPSRSPAEPPPIRPVLAVNETRNEVNAADSPRYSITASGDRSIAVGGDVSGIASTGDDSDNRRP